MISGASEQTLRNGVGTTGEANAVVGTEKYHLPKKATGLCRNPGFPRILAERILVFYAKLHAVKC